MDHQEQHHQHHQHERHEKKEEQKHHEHAAEKQPRAIHPIWFVVVGLILMAGVLAVWMWPV
jgi:Ca2+/H+ antiporter